MSTRAWFLYNDAPAGERVATNYSYVSAFPQCTTTGPSICAVLGIYDVDTFPAPRSFAIDTALDNYIIDSLAFDNAQPTPPSKPYVYTKVPL